MNFIELMKKRRSVYNLSKVSGLSEEDIVTLVKDVLKYTPAAFSMYTSNVVILFQKSHEKFWDEIGEALKNILKIRKPEAYELVMEKIIANKKAMGTVLVFEDNTLVEDLKESYAMYTDSFSAWSKEHLGILENNLWLAFAEKQIGANIQHYNQYIDKDMLNKLGIKEDGKIVTQMVFGGIEEIPEDKHIDDVDNRIRIIR